MAARDAGFPQIDAIFKLKQELEVASSLADVASSVRQLIPLIGEITPAIGIAEVKSHDAIQTALQRADGALRLVIGAGRNAVEVAARPGVSVPRIIRREGMN